MTQQETETSPDRETAEDQPTRNEAARRPPVWIRALMTFTGPWTWRNLASWVILIGSLLFIKGCVVDQYTIPSGSMETTLHGGSFFGGDRVLVNKWAMGPRIPFTTWRLWDWDGPKRWDIVVFRPTKGSSEHHTLIKRVAALPGERVRIHRGRIEVNGQRVPFPADMPENSYYVNDEDILMQIAMASDPAMREAFESLRERYPYRYGCVDTDEYTVVPEGHYFLLGDNSVNSVDARVWGWVPRNHILGRAFAIWWPWPRRRDFSGFSYTWWGKLLLYGIPAALVLFEVRQQYRERRARRRTAAGDKPESGDGSTRL